MNEFQSSTDILVINTLKTELTVPTITPTQESQPPETVTKYIIVANNIVIPAIISKYATNFATNTTCSRSIIYKENVS